MNVTCTCTFNSDGIYEFCDDECPDHAELIVVLNRINPCGCGLTQAREDMINLIRDVLAAHEQNHPVDHRGNRIPMIFASSEQIQESIAENAARRARLKELLPTDAIRYLVLGMLSQGPIGHNWLEHGGSIDASWLSLEGERALELLRERPEGFQ